MSSSPTINENPYDLTLFYVVTIYSLYSILIPRIVGWAVHPLNLYSAVERSLVRQISDLKEELRSISITDEFAKYAKIRRKINKAEDDLSSKDTSRMIRVGKFKIIIYIILYAISAITTIVLHWSYYYQPVLILPENSLYPFGWILSFPTGRSDCLSVLTWSFISSYIFKSLFKR